MVTGKSEPRAPRKSTAPRIACRVCGGPKDPGQGRRFCGPCKVEYDSKPRPRYKQAKQPNLPKRWLEPQPNRPLLVETGCFNCARRIWSYKGKTKTCSNECRYAQGRRSKIIERTDPWPCQRCKVERPLAEYAIIKKTGLSSTTCRECLPRATSEQKRRSHLKTKFGITLERFIEMYDDQRGKCGICTKALPPKSRLYEFRERGAKKTHGDWCVDHCHATGKVRGLLCSNCNRGIGSFLDSPSIARAAAAYLDEHAQLRLVK